ncbi:phage integrase N-terminal SAM-like domain-containing protein [Cyanobium sp. ATX 6A2]|uniref:tyrosine-type recombinase/integrase n=1 Tax=Cyanobium sp. ATX 6A2 TaxID=2823700 RepID=UPI0020CCB391|nr:phage integrase N-terminal SAM-like domain-containing protein [Cyanobium sp. ATX 6A2]
MDPSEQEHFERLFAANVQAMKLHGLHSKTSDSNSRTLRRVAGHFDRCPDDLSPDELKGYFAALLEQYSWSTIQVDLCSLQFFHRYVLDREMEWIKIIRPPRVRSLPEGPTREEAHRLNNTVRRVRYRIILLVVYSLGLRIEEGLALEVADIDDSQRRVHIRDGKGGGSFLIAGPELSNKRHPPQFIVPTCDHCGLMIASLASRRR